MRPLTLILVAALSPGLVSAETFRTTAPVEAVTIYPQAALVTRAFSVDLPPGSHEVEVALPQGQILDLDLFGAVTVTGRSQASGLLRPEAYDTPEVAAARDAVEVAEDAVRGIDRRIATTREEIAAIDVQIGFLRSITGGREQLAAPEDIGATLDLIGARLPALVAEQLAREQELTELAEAREDAAIDLVEAERALAAIAPPSEGHTVLTLRVEAEAATTFSGQMTSLTGEATWQPVYDMALETGTGALAIDRKAEVQKYSSGDWTDVALKLSTIMPNDVLAASAVLPDIVRLGRPEPMSTGGMLSAPAPAPMMEVAEDAAMMDAAPASRTVSGQGGYDGAAFVFTFGSPQTLSSGELIELALDDVALEAEVLTVAVPRRDETAFIVGEITNDSGGPLLAGLARISRDGTFMGETWIAEIADGAEATLPFGPDERIRLAYVVADRSEGDRGIISRSDTRLESVELKIENLTGEDREVRVYHALPVSEVEDLILRTRVAPEPDVRDVDDKRGVARWDLTVGAGGEEAIEIDMELAWPEDMWLDWRP